MKHAVYVLKKAKETKIKMNEKHLHNFWGSSWKLAHKSSYRRCRERVYVYQSACAQTTGDDHLPVTAQTEDALLTLGSSRKNNITC